MYYTVYRPCIWDVVYDIMYNLIGIIKNRTSHISYVIVMISMPCFNPYHVPPQTERPQLRRSSDLDRIGDSIPDRPVQSGPK